MNGAIRPKPILLKRQNLAMAWALLSNRAEIERMQLKREHLEEHP
ncbi:hypothetical protein RBWH47_03084 [Rhodopirellula baltica WH47]|uniref:Uncharacterized protein n=1 Tax=Rhodopirellula baltica WH47 TaxID=991778 RepID=F2AZW4_RHOBT|nr:hypothetical protein RBWH47_03084 [Rhodopirellula baltica WH47]